MTAVRGYSMFGMSFVYVLFDEGTDVYWARSRVLEYLSSIRAKLPTDVAPVLGPDATGIGWVYEYALVDRTGKHDLAELRASRTSRSATRSRASPGSRRWRALAGTSGSTRSPSTPTSCEPSASTSRTSRRRSAGPTARWAGATLEMSGREYFVRGRGYLRGLGDLAGVAIRASTEGTPVTIGDVGTVRMGGDIRRGLAELDGQGETVGAIVMARYGENALDVIAPGEGASSRSCAPPFPPAWRSSPPTIARR